MELPGSLNRWYLRMSDGIDVVFLIAVLYVAVTKVIEKGLGDGGWVLLLILCFYSLFLVFRLFKMKLVVKDQDRKISYLTKGWDECITLNREKDSRINELTRK